MCKTSDVFDPLDLWQLTTPVRVAEGQTTLIGESIRVTVGWIGSSKALIRIKAPDSLRILRGVLHQRGVPASKSFSQSRPAKEGSGLSLSLRLGEWASVGAHVFVGISAIGEDHIVLGIKAPPGLPVCDETTWNDLRGPSQGGAIQM